MKYALYCHNKMIQMYDTEEEAKAQMDIAIPEHKRFNGNTYPFKIKLLQDDQLALLGKYIMRKNRNGDIDLYWFNGFYPQGMRRKAKAYEPYRDSSTSEYPILVSVVAFDYAQAEILAMQAFDKLEASNRKAKSR